jgi:hypothetical protein
MRIRTAMAFLCKQKTDDYPPPHLQATPAHKKGSPKTA